MENAGHDKTSTRFGSTSLKDSRRVLAPQLIDGLSIDSSHESTPARIAYLILANGIDEMRSTKKLLKVVDRT